VSATTLVGAALQAAAVFAVGWVAGDLLLEGLLRARPGGRADVAWPERALFALVGFVLVAVGLMVAHIVTGGAVFALPGIVPAVCLALLWRGWRRGRLPSGIPALPALGAALALGSVYAYPALAGGAGLRTGDTPWHMGWTEQLLAGEPVPTGPAPRFGANAYPWGFHAVLATMVRAVPGTSPATALEALGLVVIAALPLAGACLARRLRPDAGWWGAAAMAALGGFGWIAPGPAEFVTSPGRARFGADLVAASPNALYELFPPALPRELALALLAGAGLTLLLALGVGRGPALVAGVVAALVGLVSVPLFVSASLWGLAAARSPGPRVRGLPAVGAALAVFGLWAGPVAADAVRLGGFVDITPTLGREWPLPSALGSWGLLTPLAALGIALTVRARRPRTTLLVSWALITAILLALARARALLDWGLGGNATLLHEGRVWPVAHLLAVAFAGAGVAWLRATLARRAPAVAAALVGAVFVAGVVSPWIASRSLAATIRAGEGGFQYARPDFGRGSFVRRAAGRLDPDHVVEVRGPPQLALALWQFSGARLARYDDPRLRRNDLRIRFRELARAWDSHMAEEGFVPDLIVMPLRGVSGAGVLERGRFGARAWALVRPVEPAPG
jgi:hypothetical protein